MPGVAVLPTPPTGPPSFGSSHPATQNGPGRSPDVTTASEIKEKAKEAVQKEARSASALTLIKIARSQTTQARECEIKGDLKGALSALTKAGSLAQMLLNSAEFIAEGKKGVLHNEFMQFMEGEGRNLKERVNALEIKVNEFERSQPSSSTTADEVPTSNSFGGSIADRMRALQDAGLSVGSTKRFSRELPNGPVLPSSPPSSIAPRFPTHAPSSSLSIPPLSPVQPASSKSSPATHAFVLPSSLGPPSPTSSTSSSPPVPSLADFSKAFPSIDELDELEATKSFATMDLNGAATNVGPLVVGPPSPSMQRPFPTPPADLGPRPSSTPLPPSIDTFTSRPSSPPPPSQPLATIAFAIEPDLSPPSMASERPELPVTNRIQPGVLYEYLHKRNLKILLIDVRTRGDFDQGHIKSDAIVCLEPSVLQRERVTGKSLEDSLSVVSQKELVLFTNRDKFDLVVLYDTSSLAFGDRTSPLSVLVSAIYENEFRKMLKNVPILLIGGIEAWRREIGQDTIPHVPNDKSGETIPSTTPPATYHASETVSYSGTHAPQHAPQYSMPTTASSPFWTPPAEINGRPSLSYPNLGYQNIQHSRESAETNHSYGNDTSKFSRPPTIPPRPVVSPVLYQNGLLNGSGTNITSISTANGFPSITYPQFSRPLPSAPPSAFSNSQVGYPIASPAPASINPTLSRRRTDFLDQSQESVSNLKSRQPIGYPDLPAQQQVLRPPPAVASSALDRQDIRPRVIPETSSAPARPRINSDFPVPYWADTNGGRTGLKNLGNTCYMNAMIQCLLATVPFARFFTDGRWKSAVNYMNPEGTKGEVAQAFALLLHTMVNGDLPWLAPIDFRKIVMKHREEFRNNDQHDSQEFVIFLLDCLHEDLNRILEKPIIKVSTKREEELEVLAQQISSEQEWRLQKTRDDSIVTDYFQGQFRNRLRCLTCHKTSTTFNTFRSLQVPVLSGKAFGKVTLKQCLDAFVQEEIMDGNDRWACPNCKTLRTASKHLSISRLPPVLVIQLKRFESHGRFSDKIDTLVDFPLKSLDLTSYVPPPLPPGADQGALAGGQHYSSDDPRAQTPPYRYDLYGVTNHFGGGTSSGHYTAFISSQSGWLYCDDSVVKQVDPRQVVGKPAYVLFYKRVKA